MSIVAVSQSYEHGRVGNDHVELVLAEYLSEDLDDSLGPIRAPAASVDNTPAVNFRSGERPRLIDARLVDQPAISAQASVGARTIGECYRFC